MSLVTMVPKMAGYVRRIGNVAPEFIFGTGSDLVGTTMRGTKGSVWTKAKSGFKALESSINAASKEGGFFKRLWKNLLETPGTIKDAAKEAAKVAEAAGKNKIWAGFKGAFKGIGKKMPFIASALLVIGELPNIFTAIKEKGLVQGLKETAKTGARLAGGATCAAIGSAICPGIGSLIGWVVGDWLTSKIVGKSYTEQKDDEKAKAEELAQAQAQQAQQAQPTFTGATDMGNNVVNPIYTNPYAQNMPYNDYANPYANDIMMQRMPFNAVA